MSSVSSSEAVIWTHVSSALEDKTRQWKGEYDFAPEPGDPTTIDPLNAR